MVRKSLTLMSFVMLLSASFGDKEITKKSTIGHIIAWNTYVISWRSGKTKRVTLSTCESEFLSASESIKTSFFFKNIIIEILSQHINLVLYVDNQSWIKWIKNSCGYLAKTKHIDMIYHFIREVHDANMLNVRYFPTENQIPAIFTKSFDRIKHQK